MSIYRCKDEGVTGNAIRMHATYILGRLHSRIIDSFHLIILLSLAPFGLFSYHRTSFPVLS